VRIGIDATGLPVHIAGAGRYICGLIRALAQIDRQNEYFIFLKAQTRNLLGAFSSPANLHFILMPNLPRPPRVLWQHFGAGIHGRYFRLEVWHSLHYTLPYFADSMRIVSTFHDVAFFLHPQLYPPGKRLYFQNAIRHALDKADAIISVSQSTADDVRRVFYGKHAASGLDAGKLHVVHSGIDDGFFNGVPAAKVQQVRERHGLAAPYILFVGTFEKRKNLPLLIKAFSRLRAKGHRDLMLALAGQSGNGLPEVERTIAQENLQPSVRRLGYVAEDDLPALYHGAALFVLPSVHEGFGFPLLEAMACGVPVLAADNSAIREVAAEAGRLCAGNAECWAEEMQRMLVDAALREKLSVGGRRRAQEFSWRRTAESTVAVYESLWPAPRCVHALGSPFVLEAILPNSTPPRNGSSHAMDQLFSPEGKNGEVLNNAVLKTLAYADLFDYPLCAEEIHEGLFACNASFIDVQKALKIWTSRGLVEQNGRMFFLRGRAKIVALRQQRRQQSRSILQRHARLLRLIVKFPFVRSVALSGAVAFENCKEADDVDLFIITASRRLWMVYLGLVLLLKLAGKRRVICVNCLFDLDHLGVDNRNFFVAHQIAFLRPLSGREYFQKFLSANAWVGEHLPQIPGNGIGASTGLVASLICNVMAENFRLKRFVERIFSWPAFDGLEQRVFRLYSRRIHRMTRQMGSDSVVVRPGQIKLFTNNHRSRITDALQHRLQELLHLNFSHQEEVEESHAVVQIE
jgi:glycosyltransferase involved in cell wall biosynthesis